MASKNTSAQSGSGLAPLSDAKSKRMYQAAREYIRTCRDERYDPLWEAVTEVYVYGPFPQWEEIITSLLHHEHKEIARPFGEERNELMVRAIRSQNYKLTRLLLEGGIPLHLPDPLGTLFEDVGWKIDNVNEELLELLLSQGAKCKHPDTSSFRPLCLLGNERWVRQALTDNPDFMLRSCSFDEPGVSLSLHPNIPPWHSWDHGGGPVASNNSQRLHWIMDCVPAPLGIIGVFLDLNPPLNWGLSFVTALAAGKPEVAVVMVAREEQFTKRSSILKNEVKAAADFGYPCVIHAIFDRKDHSRASCDSIRESCLKTAQLIAYERERRHRKAGLMVSGVLTPLTGGAYRLVCQTTDPSNSSAPSRKSLVFYLDRRFISATEREERALLGEAERKIDSDDV
ncbi:hypothetical protein BO86DRAFT_384317 [Aspergillus japonicus CBS 114.51]|uniref:Ankyrin n=1 Tax=Aspergillus japonicus CBS 114.51 TaxID=1448312 RepID=A0A8T8WJ70_ASPJA|nr:hypothetical protein BO86DRAFT_384317 [Aspergillus japonicus CBS 114.51]RAH75858.1 hypothetical protein BO86DRAFT_384317 [Aspergillus japonicus CBS 114.51]